MKPAPDPIPLTRALFRYRVSRKNAPDFETPDYPAAVNRALDVATPDVPAVLGLICAGEVRYAWEIRALTAGPKLTSSENAS